MALTQQQRLATKAWIIERVGKGEIDKIIDAIEATEAQVLAGLRAWGAGVRDAAVMRKEQADAGAAEAAAIVAAMDAL